MTVTTTPEERTPPASFDELYRSSRGALFRALAAITADRDLALEAIDIGFTRWRRRVRKPSHVPADVGVMALAYRWAGKQLAKAPNQLHGFRLRPESEATQSAALRRFASLSLDERALLVMQDHLGWTDSEISHAMHADGVGAAARALQARLGAEGFGPTDLAEAIRSHAASFAEPLSRLETVKTMGSIQRAGTVVASSVLGVVIVAGVVAAVSSLAAAPEEAIAGNTTVAPTTVGAELTAESAVWQRVAPPVGGDNIMALAHDGTDFFMLAGDGRGRPVMLQSSNGLDWARIPAPATGQNTWFSQIVATPDLLMAVGNGFDEVAGRESTVVFTSTEDGSWQQAVLPTDNEIDIQGQKFRLFSWVSTVTATEDGFMIIGSQNVEFDPDQLLREVVDAGLLRHGWTATPDGMQFFDDQGNVAETRTWDELGLAPEVGSLLSGGGRPIIWTSHDGLEWEAVTTLAPPNSHGLSGYAAVGEVEAALAWGEFGSVVWVRRGGEWERPTIAGSLTALTSWQGQIIATGSDAAAGAPAVWATSDGLTWEETKIPGGVIQQLYPSWNALVGLGWTDHAALIGPARIEAGDLTVLATSDGRFQVVDAAGDTVVEVREENVTREAGMITIFDPDSGQVVVEIDEGAYESAWEAVYREIEFQGRGQPQFALVISEDGTSWTVLEPDDPSFYPHSIAYGNNRALMVGWSETNNFPGIGGGGQQLLLVHPDS